MRRAAATVLSAANHAAGRSAKSKRGVAGFVRVLAVKRTPSDDMGSIVRPLPARPSLAAWLSGCIYCVAAAARGQRVLETICPRISRST